jgi:hypothetical protein
MRRKSVTSKRPRRTSRLAKDRRHHSLAQLASEQGITGPQDFDALCGAGADLWEDDAAFKAFLAGMQETGRAGG